MKIFTSAACLKALASLPHLAVAFTNYPELQHDPETISPCNIWENNNHDLVCEDVRSYWNITPEDFSRWNPSVGLDCKPWIAASYCVVPQERLLEEPTTTATKTSSTTIIATSASSTLGPSPTSWEDRGCYVDDDEEIPTLQKKVSQDGGDAALTIAKCKDACYKGSFEFAGVKNGNECHCGSYVAGERTLNATECNVSCSGSSAERCGGVDRLNVFRALDNAAVISSATSSAATVVATVSAAIAPDDESAAVTLIAKGAAAIAAAMSVVMAL